MYLSEVSKGRVAHPGVYVLSTGLLSGTFKEFDSYAA